LNVFPELRISGLQFLDLGLGLIGFFPSLFCNFPGKLGLPLRLLQLGGRVGLVAITGCVIPLVDRPPGKRNNE
jgi:hypothetical protein